MKKNDQPLAASTAVLLASFPSIEESIVRFPSQKRLLLFNPGGSIMFYQDEVMKPGKRQCDVASCDFSKGASSPASPLTFSNESKADRAPSIKKHF